MSEPEQKFCDQCGKWLKRGLGIEIGWSVMHGKMKVCSQKCLDRLNSVKDHAGLEAK